MCFERRLGDRSRMGRSKALFGGQGFATMRAGQAGLCQAGHKRFREPRRASIRSVQIPGVLGDAGSNAFALARRARSNLFNGLPGKRRRNADEIAGRPLAHELGHPQASRQTMRGPHSRRRHVRFLIGLLFGDITGSGAPGSSRPARLVTAVPIRAEAEQNAD